MIRANPRCARLSLPACLLAACLLLAACATPSQRIAGKLTEYGVPPAQARCMGDRLAERLTTAQLRRLGEIGKMAGGIQRMTIGDIAQKLDGPDDAKIAVEVVRAGLGCVA